MTDVLLLVVVLLSVVAGWFLVASCPELPIVEFLVFCLVDDDGRSLLLMSVDLTDSPDAVPLDTFSSLLEDAVAEVGISLLLYLVDRLLCLSRLPYDTE